jgi:LysR family transcriptional activator of nhaA
MANLQDLNLHHLLYFWAVAEEGTLVGAASRLHLTHSTLSKQLRELEGRLGAPLFLRNGRRLVLTAFGRDVREYAADIARVGSELLEFAEGLRAPRRERLRVGVVSSMPKTLVIKLLQPALDREGHGSTLVRQLPRAELVALLSAGRLDVGLVDELPADAPSAKIHAHAMGETEVLWFAARELAARAKEGFPRSLATVPVALPMSGSSLRRQLDAWLVAEGVTMRPRAELEDAGLLRAFGVAGRGVIPVRSALRSEVEELHAMALVGPCHGVRERYYALSGERRVRHPAVVAILEGARASLLAPPTPRRRKGP